MPSAEGVWPRARSQTLSRQMFLSPGRHSPQLVNTLASSPELLASSCLRGFSGHCRGGEKTCLLSSPHKRVRPSEQWVLHSLTPSLHSFTCTLVHPHTPQTGGPWILIRCWARPKWAVEKHRQAVRGLSDMIYSQRISPVGRWVKSQGPRVRLRTHQVFISRLCTLGPACTCPSSSGASVHLCTSRMKGTASSSQGCGE